MKKQAGNKKKKFAYLYFIICVAALLVGMFFLFKESFVGNDYITISTANVQYADSKLQAIIDVKDQKNNTSKKSNVTLNLVDADKKDIKKTKKTFSKNELEKLNAELDIPSDVHGKCFVKAVTHSGLKTNTEYCAINIKSKDEQQNVVISFDKGIYKPNDTINYRALIINSESYKPINDNVTVNIYDANGNKVFQNESKTTEFGIVSGQFTLGDELNSGEYKLEVVSNGTAKTESFKVNPYITPQYEIKINSNKESYLVGDTADVTVNAKYFFGEPVANASIKVKINDKEDFATGITNENGDFTFNYEVKDTNSINIKVTAEDSANYYVESSKVLYASNDIFNIELLPEYGSLIKSFSNKIFVLTTKPDGSPIKTRAKVKVGDLNKQLLTDDDGIGVLDLSSDETSSLNNAEFTIEAQDNEGNTVSKTEKLDFESRSKFAVKTDKIKYNQGDDILVSVENTVNTVNKTIMVCKGNNVLKLYNTTDNDITVNLEDVTGLVDIIIKEDNTSTTKSRSKYIYDYDEYYDTINYSYPSTFSKRTVFIKPEDYLTVDVITDKEEYKPGDTLGLQVSTKANGQNTDAGILVSILDNAILSLADNDLNIDNIKLALEDVVLSDGITSADLYAMVVEDKSPAKLQALLIKQNPSDITLNASMNTSIVKDTDNIELGFLILSGASILWIIFYICKKDQGTKLEKVKKIYCTIATFVLLLGLIGTNFLFNFNLDESPLACFVVLFVIYIASLIFYNITANKLYENAFFLEFYLLISGIIFSIVYGILDNMNYKLSSDEVLEHTCVYIVVVCSIILAWIYFTYINSNNKIKQKNSLKSLTNLSFSTIAVCAISWCVEIINDYQILVAIIALVAIYYVKRKFFNEALYGKAQKAEKKVTKNNNIQINLNRDTINFIIFVIAILVVFGLFKIMTSFASGNVATISEGASVINSRDYDTSSDNSGSSRPATTWSEMESQANDFITKGKSTGDNVDLGSATKPSQYDSAMDNSSASSASSGLFDGITSILGDNKESTKARSTEDSTINTNTSETLSFENDSSNVEKTTKVRNVFLESLAFLPDLVTSDGKLSTQIPISDNITTWNIQVVGNTKNGELGYKSKEFRVFKEFFVNFELPKNSVVTDKYVLPVTIYNYTDANQEVDLKVEQADWFRPNGLLFSNEVYGNNTDGRTETSIHVTVNQNGQMVVYVPIEILQAGNNKLRMSATTNGVEDIIEKSFTVEPNGLHKSDVVSSGVIKEDYSLDYFSDENIVENSRNIKVKLYPNLISQQIENIDSILKMPTGCFEQTSSSLYPDALVLKYLNNSKQANTEIKEKALDYISKGYQRLLTFEVSGTNGGFSLYGRSPAEIALTAYGMMELDDISEVYKIDENVVARMKDYVYSKGQNSNGGFKVDENSYLGSHLGTSKLAVEAYTIWALSEVDAKDSRLAKSITYLENKISESEDTYTLALIANALVNADSSKSKNAIDILLSKVLQLDNGQACIESKIRDYYGCYGKWQNIQTTALTSLALSKTGRDSKTNSAFIKYLVSSKDSKGSWGNTQATVMALKALELENSSDDVKNQIVKITYGGVTKEAKIDKDQLQNSEVVFENAPKEGKFSIDIEGGKLFYEIIDDYYLDYNNVQTQNGFTVDTSYTGENREGNNNFALNRIVTQKINVTNSGSEEVVNGLIKINIPQGMSVQEESLSKLVVDGVIKKYDYNYNTLNLYIQNMKNGNSQSYEIKYRTVNAGEYTGGTVRVYDYYNPEYEGIALPQMMTTEEPVLD